MTNQANGNNQVNVPKGSQPRLLRLPCQRAHSPQLQEHFRHEQWQRPTCPPNGDGAVTVRLKP